VILRVAPGAAALLVIVAAVSAAAAVAASPPRPTALDWGGRYFVDRGAFQEWLHERHASFSLWARKHPTALATLDGATKVPAPLSAGDLSPAGSQHLAIGPVVAPRTPPARHTATLQLVLVALAVALLALAVAPLRIRPRQEEAWGLVPVRGLVAIRGHRLVLASAGASVIAALAVVRFVGA
jgi:hypothetical protein